MYDGNLWIVIIWWYPDDFNPTISCNTGCGCVLSSQHWKPFQSLLSVVRSTARAADSSDRGGTIAIVTGYLLVYTQRGCYIHSSYLRGVNLQLFPQKMQQLDAPTNDLTPNHTYILITATNNNYESAQDSSSFEFQFFFCWRPRTPEISCHTTQQPTATSHFLHPRTTTIHATEIWCFFHQNKGRFCCVEDVVCLWASLPSSCGV